MLDLAFVRANLELVEEKLRARGADPEALLGNFGAINDRRRYMIRHAEGLKSRAKEKTRRIETLTRRMKHIEASLGEAALKSEEFGSMLGERTGLLGELVIEKREIQHAEENAF